MKKITSLVLLTLLLIAVSVMPIQAVSIYTDGDYSFADVDANNVALYAYNGDSDVLVIPEQFSGRLVSEVYDYAFENNSDLTVIDFSQNDGNLKYIGIKSFAECTGLTGDLNLPSSIRQLNIASFQGCTGFTSLVINTGVREIPRQCFNRCSGLQNVYLPSDLETIDDLAFGNCDNLEKVYIPRSVTYISNTAFARSYPTLYVYYNSYAYQYAVDNNINYYLLDGEPVDPTTEPVTVEPTTGEPTTGEPTTEPTEELTTVEPTTVEPTTEPVTGEPTTVELTTGEPTTVEPTTQFVTVEPTTIEPTVQPTTAPVEPVLIIGDVNGDGLIDILDATKIQLFTADKIVLAPEQIKAADVNHDGFVNVLDALQVQKYVVGKAVIE